MRNIIHVSRPKRNYPAWEFIGLTVFWIVVLLLLAISSVHATENPFFCVKTDNQIKKIEIPLQLKIFKLWVSQGEYTEEQIAVLWEQSIISARNIVSTNFVCKS
jgi:hypothetical protein